MDVDTECEWDSEQISDARARADAIEEFDEEAAVQLRAQAALCERKLRGQSAASAVARVAVYDPMRLYARMGMRYPWMSDTVIDAMPRKRFFGYLRESSIAADEEKAEYDRARRGGASSGQGGGIPDGIAVPRAYEGETVEL